MGHHVIPQDTVNQPPDMLTFNNGYKQRRLSHLESPWIECTTTSIINSFKFQVQDEYSYEIKPRTTPNMSTTTFQAELQFADVPL